MLPLSFRYIEIKNRFISHANSIPNDVRCAPGLSSLKSRLKTYLFRAVSKDNTLSLSTVHMCMFWPCYCFVDGLS